MSAAGSVVRRACRNDVVRVVRPGMVAFPIPATQIHHVTETVLDLIVATGLGLVPLALSGGSAGSEIETAMAIVILRGPLTATTLNMLVVPALHLRYGGVRERIARLAASGVAPWSRGGR